jgi:hypothetical protein
VDYAQGLGVLLAALVTQPQSAAVPHRLGQRPQVRHVLGAMEPARHVEMDERGFSVANAGRDPDLPMRGREDVGEPEFGDRGGHAEHEQGFDLVSRQSAKGETGNPRAAGIRR